MAKIVQRTGNITFRLNCPADELRRQGVDLSKWLDEGYVSLCDPLDDDTYVKDVVTSWNGAGKERWGLKTWLARIGAPMFATGQASFWVDIKFPDLDTEVTLGCAYGSTDGVIGLDPTAFTGSAGKKLAAIEAVLKGTAMSHDSDTADMAEYEAGKTPEAPGFKYFVVGSTDDGDPCDNIGSLNVLEDSIEDLKRAQAVCQEANNVCRANRGYTPWKVFKLAADNVTVTPVDDEPQ